MNKKQEFEDKLGYKIVENDKWNNIRQVDVAGLWQWIEQYGTEQRLDELDNVMNFSNTTLYTGNLKKLVRDRIKELKDD